MRKSLFLILALALLFVPVFLMAHTLTHFAQVDAIGVVDAESAQVESDDDSDIDDICFACLALGAFSAILITSGFCLADQAGRQLLIHRKIRHNLHKRSSSKYPRAPPLILFQSVK